MTRSIVRLVVVAATVAVLLAGCSSGEKPTTAVPGDAEGVTLHPYEMLDLSRPDGTDEVALADPSVVKVEDTWYLYGTTDATRVLEPDSLAAHHGIIAAIPKGASFSARG